MKIEINKWSTPELQFCQIKNEIWDIPQLIQLSKELPVYTVPIAAIRTDYNITDSHEIRDFVMHMKAVMDADLQYPIILDQDGIILDGRHRLTKAIYLGNETINVVRFVKNPLPSRYSKPEKEEKQNDD